MFSGVRMDDFDFDQDELIYPILGLTPEEVDDLNRRTLELLAGKSIFVIPVDDFGVKTGHKP